MIKHTSFEQGSLEWLQARVGIPTASEWDALVTPKFEVRKGAMVETYLAQKVAERWLGSPLPGFMTIDMEVGKIQETEAIPAYSWDKGVEIEQVGFITTDDGKLGCSPDGLIGSDCGIEIKCPEAKTHTRYLLDGILPPDYAVQVQGSMLVTGMAKWVFFSYRRRFPHLILTVERDQKAQNAISEALAAFLARFDAAIKHLEELNGGPAKRHARPISPFHPSTPQPEQDEITP